MNEYENPIPILEVVEAALAFAEAVDWIKKGRYRFNASPDACDECAANDEVVFPSDFIPDVFPYCEPSSNLIVFPMVHPHCRCQLIWLDNKDKNKDNGEDKEEAEKKE